MIPPRTPVRRRVLAAVLAAATVGTLAVGSWITAAPAQAATSPGVIGRVLVGYSVQHRPIYAYRMGDPTSPVKGVILGQMHGDEAAGVHVVDAILHGSPVHGLDLWVIPTMNPDGLAAHTRQNAHHVDLNRNWPNNWAHLTGEYYSGPKPLSEPETVAMYAFLNRVRPTFMVSMHQPLDGVDNSDGGKRNPAFLERLSVNLGLPEKPLVCWSVCRGSMTGWVLNHQAGSAITVEFPTSPSSSYLAGTAPRGILAAMGVRYGRPLTASAAGDLDSDGRADLVAVKPDGSMWEYLNHGDAARPFVTATKIGASGWNGYDRLALGDVTGDGRADLLATNAQGQLYEFPNSGNAAHPFATRLLIGASGWQGLNQLALGDLDGKHRADLVVTDSAGRLYELPNTGSATRPFASRQVIGSSGWNAFDRLALGDVTGDGRADLLATNTQGQLYEYPSTGSATRPFATRRLIGASGWSGLNRVMLGDLNHDAQADLFATDATGRLHEYLNTGSATRPFAGGSLIGSGWNGYARLI